jgi:hypothetical protein
MVKMKQKIILLLFISILLILCVFIPTIKADSAIMITSYSLNPQILMPGDTTELIITLTNTETTSTTTSTSYSGNNPTLVIVDTNSATIENVWITSDGDGEYSIKANKNFEDIGDLAPGSSISISFELTSHINISEGLYYPIINVDVEDVQDVKFPIPIRISNLSSLLLEKEVPSKISNSGSTPIILTFVNKKQTTINDVTLNVINSERIHISPNTFYLGNVSSGSSQDITFYLKPIKKGFENLSFSVNYRYGYNTHYNNISIPIEVVDTLDVSPVLYDFPKTIKQNSSQRISLEVFNAKSESITGVLVTPITNLSISPSQYFIGSMDPDDVFSASFELETYDLKTGTYSIGFKVLFKQDNDYYESPILEKSFQVVNNDFMDETTSPFIYIGIGVALTFGALYIYYLFINRRKSK